MPHNHIAFAELTSERDRAVGRIEENQKSVATQVPSGEGFKKQLKSPAR